MWLIQGDIAERQIIPPNGIADEEARPTGLTTFWLRPQTNYIFGRRGGASVQHIWSEPKSASRQHVEIKAGAVSAEGSKLTASQVTTYNLVLRNMTKRTWLIERADDTTVELEQNNEVEIMHGDRVTLTKEGQRNATFLWRPLDLFFISSKSLKNSEEWCTTVGTRYIGVNTRTDEPFTHLVTKIVTARAVIGEAALLTRPIVDDGWIDELKLACTPKNALPATHQLYDQEDALSPLERNFDKHWPKANDHLPTSAADEYGQRPPDGWAIKEARLIVFEKAFFVAEPVDAGTHAWVRIATLAGGKVCTIPEAVRSKSTAEVAKWIKDYRATHNLDDELHAYYLMDQLLIDRTRAREVAFQAELIGLVSSIDIFEAIYQASLDTLHLDKDYSAAKQAVKSNRTVIAPATPVMDDATPRDGLAPNRRILAPPSSMLGADDVPPASANTEVPSTIPGELDVPPSTQETEMAPPPPKKKPLIRRAGNKAELGAHFFGPNFGLSPAPSTSASMEIGPSQSQTSNGYNSQINGGISPSDAGGTQSLQLETATGTSRTAKLKRRAGQRIGLSLGMPGDDPVPASVVEATPAVAEMDVDPDSTPRPVAPAKRKEVEASEDTAAPAMKKGKKAPAAVSAAKGKKGKKAVEEPEEEPETDPAKYLQINKRGKAGEKEAEFNAEFNQLKIVKPTLDKPYVQQSKKIGWRDRDLDEEELAEMATWDNDTSKSFFNIIRVPLARPADAQRKSFQAANMPAHWRSIPNYKAFRPKNSSIPARPQRVNVELVLSASADFGLGAGYDNLENGATQKGKTRLTYDHDDSDEDESMQQAKLPFGRPTGTAAKAKGKAKAVVVESEDAMDEDVESEEPVQTNTLKGKKKAPAASASASKAKAKAKTPTASRKKVVIEEESSDEEEDEFRESALTVKKTAKRKAPAKPTLTIDSDDDEDGLTFVGFTGTGKRKR